MGVLAPRHDMTGADREWARCYQIGDVLHYTRGSKEHGVEPRSYAQVVSTTPAENLLTVQTQDGRRVTYDPSRLLGIAAYREVTVCNSLHRIVTFKLQTATLVR
jgi:hypothetical protein